MSEFTPEEELAISVKALLMKSGDSLDTYCKKARVKELLLIRGYFDVEVTWSKKLEMYKVVGYRKPTTSLCGLVGDLYGFIEELESGRGIVEKYLVAGDEDEDDEDDEDDEGKVQP